MSDGKSSKPIVKSAPKPTAKPTKPAPKLVTASATAPKPSISVSKPPVKPKGSADKGVKGKEAARSDSKVGGGQKGVANKPKASGGEPDKKRKRVEVEPEPEEEVVEEPVDEQVEESPKKSKAPSREEESDDEAEEVHEDISVEEAEELDNQANLSQKEQVALEAHAAELFVLDGLTWLKNFCDELEIDLEHKAVKQAMYSTLAVVANKFLKIRDGGERQNKHTAPYNAKKIARIAQALAAQDNSEEMEE